MYESPIKLTWENFDEVCKKMTLDEENAIIRCVRIQANVDVDKVELLRALQYDRDQYYKGFHDGKRDAMKWVSVKESLPGMPPPEPPEVGRPLKALRRMEGKRMNVKTFELEDGRKYLVPAQSCFNCRHLGPVLYDDDGPHTIMCQLSEDEKYADYAADMGLKCDAFEEKEEEE